MRGKRRKRKREDREGKEKEAGRAKEEGRGEGEGRPGENSTCTGGRAQARGRCTPSECGRRQPGSRREPLRRGQSRDPRDKPYFDRSRHRRGMVDACARSRASPRLAGGGLGRASWAGEGTQGLHALLVQRATDRAYGGPRRVTTGPGTRRWSCAVGAVAVGERGRARFLHVDAPPDVGR